METVKRHSLNIHQRGSIRHLHRVCIEYGWEREANVIIGERFVMIGDFFNAQPDEIVLELISIHEGVYGYLDHPTEKAKRLHAMKWKI